ncbi:MAG TPA: delta-60 repeat domain-containing protein, partial [Flavisolibacter sp.]|nr:delta-60 repeat domain-containing protein [Flavisolibacter sp.]
MKKILFILLSVSPGLSAFSQAGSLDPSFGSNGIVRTDFGSPVNISSYICQQILLHQDGSFYLILSSGEQSIIAHRLANTSLDQSYGENGYSVPVPIGNPHAVLQPDGKIVIGGYSMFNDNFDFALARFNPDGFPDTTFSEDGKQSTDFLMNHDYINAIALQSDGKIVVAGYTTIDNTTNFALARYNPDGSPDLSFSGDGKQ